MILTRTPLRVSLFGGGPDYPAWFERHEGAVLGMAIDKYVYVGVKRMPPGQSMKYRVQYSKVQDCMLVSEIKHPAVRGALEFLKVDHPLEFHIFADQPGRSGLGGSSAFVVGLLHALHRQLVPSRESLDAWQLVDAAIMLERDVIKEAVGCQDQIFAAHGGLKFLTFSDIGRTVRTLDLPGHIVRELEQRLVLVHTGTMRDAHEMAAKQIALIEDGFNTAVLTRLAEIAHEGLELLLEGTDRERLRLGQLLHEGWELKKRLHPEISSKAIDQLYLRGLDLGATGGKLLGAGGGGFMLFFVPSTDDMLKLRRGIGTESVDFRIAWQGTHVLVNEPT